MWAVIPPEEKLSWCSVTHPEPEPGREVAQTANPPSYWSLEEFPWTQDLLIPLQWKDRLPQCHCSQQERAWLCGWCKVKVHICWICPGRCRFCLARTGCCSDPSCDHTLLCAQRPVSTRVAADGISLSCGAWPAFCQPVLSSTYPSKTALPAAWPFGQNQPALYMWIEM